MNHIDTKDGKVTWIAPWMEARSSERPLDDLTVDEKLALVPKLAERLAELETRVHDVIGDGR